MNRIKTVLLALIATGLISFSLFGYSSVYASLTGNQTLPAREAYTELAFNNHLALPHIATGTPEPIQFHITNHEGTLKNYTYTITSSANGATKILNTGTVSVADGATATVNYKVVLPKKSPLTLITITIPETKQAIHFWIGATE